MHCILCVYCFTQFHSENTVLNAFAFKICDIFTVSLCFNNQSIMWCLNLGWNMRFSEAINQITFGAFKSNSYWYSRDLNVTLLPWKGQNTEFRKSKFGFRKSQFQFSTYIKIVHLESKQLVISKLKCGFWKSQGVKKVKHWAKVLN